MTSLGDSGNTLESYSYLGLATIVKRAHPQSGVDLSYIKLTGESVGDAGDQYTGLDRFKRIVDHRWVNGSNVDVDRFKYGYDRNGNRLFKENGVIASLSEVYSYDDLNQIAGYKLGTLNTGKTDVTGTPTKVQSWDYDAVGNWDSVTTNSATQTRGANRQNEITSVSGATTPTYDNNGNLTKDENDNRFVWDAWNMMVQVRNASNVVIVTMGRDALHRHVTDTEGTSLKDRSFGLEWQLLETKAGSNTVTRLVWSPAYVDALVLRDRDTDSNGTMDERIYPLQDANWNTTALVNTSGTVVERDTYTPFGVVTYWDASGSALSASAKDWVFLHQGGEQVVGGDYEFRNRVYSPTLGRWLSNDPLEFEARDVNIYRYVGNGSGNGLDPLGLADVKLFIEDKGAVTSNLSPTIGHWIKYKFKGNDEDLKKINGWIIVQNTMQWNVDFPKHNRNGFENYTQSSTWYTIIKVVRGVPATNGGANNEKTTGSGEAKMTFDAITNTKGSVTRNMKIHFIKYDEFIAEKIKNVKKLIIENDPKYPFFPFNKGVIDTGANNIGIINFGIATKDSVIGLPSYDFTNLKWSAKFDYTDPINPRRFYEERLVPGQPATINH